MPTAPERPNLGARLQGYRALGVGAAVTVVVMVLVGAVSGQLGGGSDHDPAPLAAATETSAPTSRPTGASSGAVQSATTTPATVTTLPATPSTTSADPGVLPQTEAKPDPSSITFTDHVNALWSAVVADDPTRAMPFFFPLSAYKQVKSISDPEGDWNSRLVAAFKEDVHAWHTQLGANAAGAQLTAVSVPSDQAQWILPGAEYNKGSYWRVYGTTLRYQVDGRAGTFAVASMISWRGEWYVVHLASIR
jgi:hypothetical protein